MTRAIDRDNPQEREAAQRLLKMLDDPKLCLDDILAHGSILNETDELKVAVGGINFVAKVHR